MKKRQLLYSIAVIMPASFLALYFGLALAFSSVQGTLAEYEDQEDCFIDAQAREEILKAHAYLSLYDDVDESVTSKKNIEKYLRRYLQTAGRTKCLYSYLPTVIDYCEAASVIKRQHRQQSSVRRPGPPAEIRPRKAHTLWKKLQTHYLFRWPVHPKKFWVSSYFGPRTLNGQKGYHRGIDLAARTGTPVVAAAAGKVIEATYSPGYGNYIVIEHAQGYKTRYAHLSCIIANEGQEVHLGQVIGKVGATGKVTKNKSSASASHLHFEVYADGTRVNPLHYVA